MEDNNFVFSALRVPGSAYDAEILDKTKSEVLHCEIMKLSRFYYNYYFTSFSFFFYLLIIIIVFAVKIWHKDCTMP